MMSAGLRQCAHWLAASLALAFFAVSAIAFCFVVACAVLANAIMPSSRYGNCWIYALPRWWRYGGYLAVRRADGVGLCRVLPVPHVIWISHLARRGNVLSQFVPEKRRQTKCWPKFVGYYDGEVRNVESPRDAATRARVEPEITER